MNTKKSCFKTIAVLFVVSAVLLLGSSPVYAADTCQIIRIDKGIGAGGTRLEIFPEKITIPVGTCTVWINWVQGREVRVSFRDNAKACMMATDEKVSQGFELQAGEACYISEKLPRGRTASLYWTTPGIYKYSLEGEGSATGEGYAGKMLATGVIEVK